MGDDGGQDECESQGRVRMRGRVTVSMGVTVTSEGEVSRRAYTYNGCGGTVASQMLQCCSMYTL